MKKNSLERATGDLRLLCLALKDPLVSAIGEKDIIEHLQMMRDLGYKHNAICKKTLAYRKFFKWLNDRGYPVLPPSSIPKMRQEATMPRVVTEEEYKKLLKAIPPEKKKYCYLRDQAIIRLLWDTGARVGEISSLNIPDCNLEEMKAVIKTEKSRGQKPFREIYWTKETNDFLKRWIERRQKLQDDFNFDDAGSLFVSANRYFFGQRITSETIGIFLRKYSRIAKIPTANPHSFRHHMGHDLSEKGANNSQISSILGHSSLASSFIYTELNNKEREQTYNKFKRGKVA